MHCCTKIETGKHPILNLWILMLSYQNQY